MRIYGGRRRERWSVERRKRDEQVTNRVVNSAKAER